MFKDIEIKNVIIVVQKVNSFCNARGPVLCFLCFFSFKSFSLLKQFLNCIMVQSLFIENN